MPHFDSGRLIPENPDTIRRIRTVLAAASVLLTIVFFVILLVDHEAAQSFGPAAALIVLSLTLAFDFPKMIVREPDADLSPESRDRPRHHPLRRRTDKVVAGAMIWGTILTLLAAWAVSRQGDIVNSAKHSANEAKAAAATAQKKSDSIQEGRSTTFGTICSQLRTNTVGVNNLTDALDALIIGGVKQSKAFSKVYKKFGLPSYQERLAQAERETAKLNATKVDPVNCAQLKKQGNIPPKPTP